MDNANSAVKRNRNHGEVQTKVHRGFYGTGKYRFAIYPDYWKDSWGKKPLLGFVWADDEFYAEREAYSRKLLPMNYTFGPLAVKLKPRNNEGNNQK